MALLIKKQIEKDFDLLRDVVELYVLERIEYLCRKNKWTYQGSFSYNVYSDGLNGREEVGAKEIHDLIQWYEDMFGRFNFYVCVEGEWSEGETTLLQITKPDFKYANKRRNKYIKQLNR